MCSRAFNSLPDTYTTDKITMEVHETILQFRQVYKWTPLQFADAVRLQTVVAFTYKLP